jgi:hypothetical protein
MPERVTMPFLSVGQVLSTPGAIATFLRNAEQPRDYLRRHVSGDWGELSAEDKAENEYSLRNGFRIMSVYRLRDGTKIWVITEADRSATTFLLPEEC